jgi:hypothetical protein
MKNLLKNLWAWLRRSQTERQIDRVINQQWTAADEEKWQRLGRRGLLGWDLKKR